MNTIKAIPAQKQPLLWRQTISQSKFGILNWKNFYCYPLTKWFFTYKNHESYLVDYLIYGSNPILTFLSLLKLYNKASEDHRNGLLKEPIHIGILLSDKVDYWGYHLFEEQNLWNSLHEKTQFSFGKSFVDFLENQKDIFFNNEYIKVTLIKQDNISVSYYNKDELYTKGYVLHLKTKSSQASSYQEAMPNVLLSINNIRDKYVNELSDFLFKEGEKHNNIQALEFTDKFKDTHDTEEKTHILLAKNIILTSLPVWINATNTTEQIKNNDSSYYVTNFNHALELYALGSAKHTPNDFLSMEDLVINDFVSLFKKGLTF